MESRSHALAAGLFTVAFVAALVAWGWWLTGRGPSYRAAYVVVSQTAVSGLVEEAPVRYLGVDVGRVERIRFDPQQPRTILITIVVDPSAQVTDRTYAQLGYQGVTGISYLQLQEEGTAGRPLPTSRRSPARIPMRPSLLQAVGASGQELMASARDAADRLAAVLNPDNAQRISETLGNVQETTRGFAEMQRAIAPTLKRLPDLSRELHTVLARADVLVGNLNGLTVEAQRRTDALDTVSRTAREIGAVAGEFHDVTLPQANRLMDHLTRSSESLDEVLRAQRDRPLGLIFGPAPPPPGPGEPGYGGSRSGGHRD